MHDIHRRPQKEKVGKKKEERPTTAFFGVGNVNGKENGDGTLNQADRGPNNRDPFTVRPDFRLFREISNRVCTSFKTLYFK